MSHDACAGDNEQVVALDHDFSAYSLTPSVTLRIDLPSDVLTIDPGSFYKGACILTLKDSILQASNPLRHAAELLAKLPARRRDDVKVCAPLHG